MAGLDHEQSSPNSSEEVESYHATPATRLSPFSSDNTRDFSNTGGRRISRANVPPAFDLPLNNANFGTNPKQATDNSFGFQDPFVSGSSFASTTTGSSTDASKLSPDASTFTPASLLDSPLSVKVTGRSGNALSVPQNDYRGTIHGVPGLVALSAKASPTSSLANASSSSSSNATKPLPHSSQASSLSSSPGFKSTPPNFGQFSSGDGTSRSLVIQVGAGRLFEQIEEHLNVSIRA